MFQKGKDGKTTKLVEVEPKAADEVAKLREQIMALT